MKTFYSNCHISVDERRNGMQPNRSRIKPSSSTSPSMSATGATIIVQTRKHNFCMQFAAAKDTETAESCRRFCLSVCRKRLHANEGGHTLAMIHFMQLVSNVARKSHLSFILQQFTGFTSSTFIDFARVPFFLSRELAFISSLLLFVFVYA